MLSKEWVDGCFRKYVDGRGACPSTPHPPSTCFESLQPHICLKELATHSLKALTIHIFQKAACHPFFKSFPMKELIGIFLMNDLYNLQGRWDWLWLSNTCVRRAHLRMQHLIGSPATKAGAVWDRRETADVASTIAKPMRVVFESVLEPSDPSKILRILSITSWSHQAFLAFWCIGNHY